MSAAAAGAGGLAPDQLKGRANAVDQLVGRNVKSRRIMLGMSQNALAEAIGVSFQQVQKYESGANRLGASRLHQVAEVLDVPIGYFFEGDTAGSGTPADLMPPGDDEIPDLLVRRETLELVQAYYSIDKPAVRRRFRALVASLAEGPKT